MHRKIKTIIIGYGHLGKWHVEKALAHPLAELVGVVDPNAEARSKVKESYPSLKVFTQIEEALPVIEAAFIVTPTSLHYKIFEQLINNNVHIFCEKPMTSTLSEALSLQTQLEGRSIITQIGHSERFHEIWERKDLFSPFLEGAGTFRLNRLAPFKGRATDVDVVQDLMIHDLDLITWILNEKPVSITSTGYKMRTDFWDYVCSELLYESGKKVIITVGRNHVEEVRDFEVTNKEGCLKIDLMNNKFFLALSNREENFVDQGLYNKRDHLYLEHDNFYHSILEGKQPIVSFNEGRDAVELVEKVLESLEK